LRHRQTGWRPQLDRRYVPGSVPAGAVAMTDDGGLIGYGPNVPANFYRAAAYVDRILKGEKAGDLPIEQPAKLDFVINLKTARSLGISLPDNFVARADDVIERSDAVGLLLAATANVETAAVEGVRGRLPEADLGRTALTQLRSPAIFSTRQIAQARAACQRRTEPVCARSGTPRRRRLDRCPWTARAV
jgi:hypothetical protein